MSAKAGQILTEIAEAAAALAAAPDPGARGRLQDRVEAALAHAPGLDLPGFAGEDWDALAAAVRAWRASNDDAAFLAVARSLARRYGGGGA